MTAETLPTGTERTEAVHHERMLSDSHNCIGRNKLIKLLSCKNMLPFMKKDDPEKRAMSLEIGTLKLEHVAVNHKGLPSGVKIYWNWPGWIFRLCGTILSFHLSPFEQECP